MTEKPIMWRSQPRARRATQQELHKAITDLWGEMMRAPPRPPPLRIVSPEEYAVLCALDFLRWAIEP